MTVLTRDDGDVRMITLNRPEKLNAANPDLQRSVLEAFEALRDEPNVGAVVLTGSGRAFSSGGDYSVIEELGCGNIELSHELDRINRATVETMLLLDRPIVAAVNGPAVGYGAALLALCDIIVMARAAYICEPHVKYGFGPSPACQLMWPRQVSHLLAKELLMTGRRIGAEEAVKVGLASQVVDNGEELATALRIATGLAALPRQGVAAARLALNEPLAEEARRQSSAKMIPTVFRRHGLGGDSNQ